MMRALLFLAALFAATTASYSQAVYGSIVGTVTDSSGSVLAGAKLTITDTSRDVSVNTTSNDSGNFNQRFLIAGRYRIRVEAPGFKTYVQENIGVSVDTDSRVDIPMQIGEVTQTLEVTGEASILKTERSDVATTFSDQTITNIPVPNRRFSNLQLMTPGVVSWPTSATAAAAENPQGSFRMLVNGQSFADTSHLLDGTDNHDAVLGWLVINPTLESVTEAKITTANYDAEFGVASAGVVSAQTKSGTNQIHGSAFEYLRNNVMQARNPFTQSRVIPGSNGRTIPLTQWNQFGGAVGGAIIKNKLFYFGDFQGTRRNTGGGALLRVPSAPERAGDLSSLNVPIYDPLSGPTPATRTRFPGDRIPAARLSPQSQALLRQIPLPNAPAILDQPNFASSGGVKYDDESFTGRVDHFTTDKLHVFGRYTLQQFRILAPGSYGDAGGGLDASGNIAAFAGKSDTRNQSVAGGFDYAMRSNLLTDFRFGWVRYNVVVAPNGVGTSPARDAGIPGLNLDNNFTSGMPGFWANGYGSGCAIPFRFGYGRPDLIYSAMRDETFPLYRNTGISFEEVTAATRLNVLSRLMAGWGILFADLDNDGQPDILAARSDALSVTGGRGAAAKEPPSWFRQQKGRYEHGTGWEALPKAMWRGAAVADLNQDGCLDVVLTALEGAPQVLRHPCAGAQRWLAVDVRTPGARIRVGTSQWRFVSSASGYASSVVAPQHFGLGAATFADVEVIWPGGITKIMKAVEANRIVKVTP